MQHINADDMAEILNLVGLYCITRDNADAEGFMQTWVEPADFGGYDSGAHGSLDSWDAMLAFELAQVGPGGRADGTRHLSLNIVIEAVCADEAHVTHDLVVLDVCEPPRVVATGRYNRSVVVKTRAGWRFKRRTLDLDAGSIGWMAASQPDRAVHG